MAFRIVDNVLFSFDDTEGIKDIHIPEGVKEFGILSFMNCTNLENVYIPDSVTYMGLTPFIGCNSLKSISVPNNLSISSEGIPEDCRIIERNSDNMNKYKMDIFNRVYKDNN